jgi:hypothetical protein
MSRWEAALIRNPILKVLSTFSRHNVKALLMGGQACILYGAAEFSRDSDFVVLADKDNLDLLQSVLRELQAEVIAVPPFEAQYLKKGHAVHFRCRHPDVDGLRIDLMSVLRGSDPFEALWNRRQTIHLEGGAERVLVLSLPDLVQAKKTQRDKDWPVIRRLLEADYLAAVKPSHEKIFFWLRESRTPEILCRLCQTYADQAALIAAKRPALAAALSGDLDHVAASLVQEEAEERRCDAAYWKPLRQELELLRHGMRT